MEVYNLLRLRVYPQSLSRFGIDSDEKIRRKKKRVKALALALPDWEKNIYYGQGYYKRAKEFAEVLGEKNLLPIDQMVYKGPNSVQIIIDNPEKMSQELWLKSNTRIEFDQAKAVLSNVDIQGDESVQWAYNANNWIFFAYPEEILVPARKGTGMSLQDLLLPKIEEGAKKIKKNMEWYIKEPQAIEAVHQYRVSIRSFRALISMVKPLLREYTYAKIQDIFRQKARAGARLRELDVLLEEWDDVRNEEDKALREALLQERKDEEKDLLQILKDPKTEQEITSGVNQFIHALSMTEWHSIDGIQFMDERLHAWYRFTLEALWEMDEFDFPSVHRVRLKSKKYRYISEFFAEYMTQTQDRHHKSAKKRQKVLGEICDALRNQEAVEELLPKLHVETVKEAEIFINKESQREVDLLTSIGLMDVSEIPKMTEKKINPPLINEEKVVKEFEKDKIVKDIERKEQEAPKQSFAGEKKEENKKRTAKDYIIFILIFMVCFLFLTLVKNYL